MSNEIYDISNINWLQENLNITKRSFYCMRNSHLVLNFLEEQLTISELKEICSHVTKNLHIDVIEDICLILNSKSEEVLEILVEANPACIKHIENPTKKLYELAVKINPDWIKVVPSDLLTLEMYKQYITKYPYYFYTLDECWKTEELCEIAIKHSIHNIGHIKNVTENMALLVAEIDPSHALSLITEPNLLTEKFYITVVSKTDGYKLGCGSGYLLRNIPVESQTEAIGLAAVKTSHDAFHYVKSQTEAICLEAIKRHNIFKSIENPTTEMVKIALTTKYPSTWSGSTIRVSEIPEYLIDGEISDLIIDLGGHNLEHIPLQHRTPELIDRALLAFSPAIKYLSEEEQTKERCYNSVNDRGNNIKYIKNQTQELCDLAVDGCPAALCSIDEEFQTEENCLKAVQKEGWVLNSVKNKTEKICLEAIKQYPECIVDTVENPTDEMYLAAISKKGVLFTKVPEDKLTESFCVEAIRLNPEVFILIKNKTETLCKVALTENPKLLPYVKDRNETITKHFLKLNVEDKTLFRYLDGNILRKLLKNYL